MSSWHDSRELMSEGIYQCINYVLLSVKIHNICIIIKWCYIYRSHGGGNMLWWAWTGQWVWCSNDTLEGTTTDEGSIELQNICMLYLKVNVWLVISARSDATQLDKTSLTSLKIRSINLIRLYTILYTLLHAWPPACILLAYSMPSPISYIYRQHMLTAEAVW